MERYVCIHGHFYQPPRENSWLEAVELQDSAYPYHDWNERVTAECYATNATSRILDAEGRITEIVNNYGKISFNFGPTLLAWLQQHAPDVYQAILEADQVSQSYFSGHGSALAQAYNHMILPLANRRDKVTQVVWGIRDFETRFGRLPEGLWLAETAVDLETLDVLAEFGIKFTILAPHQASRVRALDAENWEDVSGGRIDPTMPYLIRLPSDRSMALFFYDGPISRAVAFEGLLNRGDVFARRLMDGFSQDRNGPQILHIATDGESYGHHHHRGNMALAYALHTIESQELARLTNYGEYLEKYPPSHEVEIYEKSSWSCAHGVDRWWRDCGCSSGQHPGWNQAWRTPLREAFDWLRDTLAPAFEEKLGKIFHDPWEARNDYVRIILDRSPHTWNDYLNRHAAVSPEAIDRSQVVKLLELQRHALLMYTSCGWFFDEISGIETVQVIQYAGRALQLAHELFEDAIESRFLELLARAPSNIGGHKDGRRIFEKFVQPAMVNLDKVGAHYAISSMFEDYPDKISIYCYAVARQAYRYQEVGRTKLAVGRLRVTSEITDETQTLCFGVMHWGDHNISGCLRSCTQEEPSPEFTQDVFETFLRADFPATLFRLENYFGASGYSLRNLFRDEQRKILTTILESTLADAEGLYRQIYDTNAPLLRFLTDIRIPAPGAIMAAAQYILNASLKRSFEAEEIDLEVVRELLENADMKAVPLDATALEMTIRRRLEQTADAFRQTPHDLPLLQRFEAMVSLAQAFPFDINFRKIQNIFYELLQRVYPEYQRKVQKRPLKKAREWLRLFSSLGDKLVVRIPER